MSATKAERITSTQNAADVMTQAVGLEALEKGWYVRRRLRTPWNNNRHKFVKLARLPLHWNWTKFEYIIGD